MSITTYKYDVHIHTSESSKCSKTSGADYVQAYKDHGYDGIVITDHFFRGNTAIDRDVSWEEYIERFCRGYETAKEKGDRVGLKVFFGWEERIGNDEYLIYGPNKEWLKQHPELKNANQKEYFDIVQKAGGLVVEAHPFRERNYIKMIELHPFQCNAMEVCNSGNTPNQDYLAYNYCKKNRIPMTSGSDIHNVKDLSQSCFGMVFREQLNSIWDYVRIVKSGCGYEIMIPEDRKKRPHFIIPTKPIQLFDKNNLPHDITLKELLGRKIAADAVANTKFRIILEGHFMTYKTSIATFWNRSHNVTYLSGDWWTKLGCPLWGVPSFPHRRKIWKAYDTIVSLMELYPEQTFIIDRFHISQQYYDSVLGTRYYRNIEKRLSKMNTVVIYLRNHFDNYPEALANRKAIRHDYGVCYPQTIQLYREQEKVFYEILQSSTLRCIEYDVTSKSIEEITNDLELLIKSL